MPRTLSSDSFHFVQFGFVIGYNAATLKGQSERQTESSAPLVGTTADPFEALFGRYDNDPSWEDFPRWLKEYRASVNERDLVSQR